MSEKRDDNNDEGNMDLLEYNENNRDFSELNSKSEKRDITEENKNNNSNQNETPLIIIEKNQNKKNDIKTPYKMNSPNLTGGKNLLNLHSSGNQKSNKNFRDNLNYFESKKLYMNKNILKIEIGHLNIYEREKKILCVKIIQ